MQSVLAAMAPVYERAKIRLRGEDKLWEDKKEQLILEAGRKIAGFQGQDPASKAVLIIGQVQSIFQELAAPRRIVAEFETKRKRYIEACVAEGKKPTVFEEI